MPRDNKKKKDKCKAQKKQAFRKGIKVGVYLAKNKYTQAELNSKSSVFAEGVLVELLKRGKLPNNINRTTVRRMNKSQRVAMILARQ